MRGNNREEKFMTNLLRGIGYNFKGLKLGLKTPSLLALGLARLVIILVLSAVAIALILTRYEQITQALWTRPESVWLVWLWHLVSWLVALLLSGLAAVMAFLLAQILFSVMIMDYMSRIAERKTAGNEVAPPAMPWFSYFFYLLKQEIPRATLPVCISLLLMVLGWLTPLAPVLTVLSPLLAGIFLAWDSTDLVPARRLVTFGERFAFLRRHLGFHLGFGACFMIPGLNILLLAFAPVGGTLYYLDNIDKERNSG
jgi:CysZ protein